MEVFAIFTLFFTIFFIWALVHISIVKDTKAAITGSEEEFKKQEKKQDLAAREFEFYSNLLKVGQKIRVMKVGEKVFETKILKVKACWSVPDADIDTPIYMYPSLSISTTYEHYYVKDKKGILIELNRSELEVIN